MKIYKDRKYRTRDGSEVIIGAINGNASGRNVVIGWIKYHEEWHAHQWREDGRAFKYKQIHSDLVEVPEFKSGQVWMDSKTGKRVFIHKRFGEKLRYTHEDGFTACISTLEINDLNHIFE